MTDNGGSDILYRELSYQIVGVAFKVHSSIGTCLPEHCYQRALVHEFHMQGIPCQSQVKHDVFYDGVRVGHFFSDLIIDSKIILELKSDERITQGHVSQLFTYLKVTGMKLGYVINFGTKSLQFKRIIH